MEKFLPFALPDLDENEINAVVECLRSGWITTGPKTQQFEQDFRAYFGEGFEAVSINSATAGLHLALEALGVGPGDEVIIPTLTFTATGEVVRYLGADVVCVDVDPETLNIDPRAVEAAVTPRTKVIIPVHYAGLACDMDRLMAIAEKHGLKIIEDAAHAFPTRYRGDLIGTLNTAATVFSFYANKTMTTGEGGMVVTRDRALADRVRKMRIHGIDRIAFDRYTSTKPAWHYEVVAPGFKYNLTDIASAMGIHQLKKIDRFLVKREELAARYAEKLSGLPLILPPSGAGNTTHAWHLYVIRLTEKSPVGRDQLIEILAERGIGTSVHYIPLHRHPYWRETYGLKPEQFPNAEKIFSGMLSIPLYTKMSFADQDRVVNALKAILV